MSVRSLQRELEKIRGEVSLKMKPICEWKQAADADYLGIDDLSVEVDIRTLLTLEHNAILHRYHLLKPEDDSWKEKLQPVPGIPQSWGNVELAKEVTDV